MSYSYDRYERRRTSAGASRRNALGYWIPLAVTVTVATVGLAAWVWSERRDHDDDDYYDDRKDGDRSPPEYREVGPGGVPYQPSGGGPQMHDESFMTRMSGAIRRTPSPQQIFDGASRRVAAGVSAAGAAMGGALSAIREEDRRDFEDHSRWSEEAETRPTTATAPTRPDQPSVEASMSVGVSGSGTANGRKKRKTVAVVVSADIGHHEQEEEVPYIQEYASILSHLPTQIDADTRVFVLIYAPDLKQHPHSTSQPHPSGSMTSSYSNIGHEEAHEAEKPRTSIEPVPEGASSRSRMFDTLYKEAQSMVENDTMIMPFTTSTGHVHLLRHLAPEIVYLQETLSGDSGDILSQISNWVGRIVLVVGDESGHGGLVDSEDERGHPNHQSRDRWWQDDPRIGLGKGVEVVDGLRLGDDWHRRVRGHD
ncbi:MAG: hypothetical protein LQ343_005102 [Gyalolechia ehrenbergii]|nr:MAG: hypothetical protein LQ343_005102 [Gyalolechia ehrenbergii]